MDLQELCQIVEKMKELDIPEDEGIGKVLRELKLRADSIKEVYEMGYASHRKSAVTRQESTISVEEARRALEALKSVGENVKFEQEINQIEEDLYKLREYEESMETFIGLYLNILVAQVGKKSAAAKTPRKSSEKKGAVVENQQEAHIEEEITKIGNDISHYILRSERSEGLFRKSKWLFSVKSMMKKLEKEMVEEEELESLCKEGKKLLESNLIEESGGTVLIQMFKKEVIRVERIKDCVEKMKKFERGGENKEQVRFKDFEEASDMLKECRAVLEAERKYMKSISEKCKTLRERIADLVEDGLKQKKPLKEFSKMVEVLEKCPVLLEERGMISGLMEERNSLNSLCEGDKKMDFQTLNSIGERYNKYPIMLEKVEEVLKPFDGISIAYRIIKKKAKEMEMSRASLKELDDLKKKAKDMEKYIKDSWLEGLQLEIFLRKCELIKQLELQEGNQVVIKALLEEGQEFRGKDKRVMDYMVFFDPNMRLEEGEEEEQAQKTEEKEEVVGERKPVQEDIPIVYMHELDAGKAAAENALVNEGTKPGEQEKKDEGEGTEKSQGKVTVPANAEKKEKEARLDSITEDLEIPIKKKESVLKLLTQLFGGENKENKEVKDKDRNVVAISHTLEGCKNLEITEEQRANFSKMIFSSFKEMEGSKEEFGKVMSKVKAVLKYPGISKRLVKRGFESEYLKNILKKDEAELKIVETRLQERRELIDSANMEAANTDDIDVDIMSSAPLHKKRKEEEGETIIQTNKHSPAVKVTMEVDLYSPTKKNEKENQNHGSSLGTFNVGINGPETRQIPLKKLLQGEKAIDLTKEEGNEQKEWHFIEDDVGIQVDNQFLDDGNANQNMGPISEIIYEKKLPARQLEPNPGNKKHHRKEVAEPILYDPDSPKTRGVKKYKEDYSTEIKKKAEPGKARVESVSETLLGFNNIPNGTVLKIFDGFFKYGGDSKYPKIALFTCNSFNIVKTIPELVEEGSVTLRMAGKMAQSTFEEYFNKALRNPGPKDEKIIAGWIESHVSISQNSLDQIANELLESKMVGVIPYNESAKVYIMHKQQMSPQWVAKLDFKIKKIQKGSNPYLCFIILHKPYKLQYSTKSITPEIVLALDGNATVNMDLKSIKDFKLGNRNSRKSEDEGSSPTLDRESDYGIEVTQDQDDMWEEGPRNELLTKYNKEIKVQPTSPPPRNMNSNGKRPWEDVSIEKSMKSSSKRALGDPRKKVRFDLRTADSFSVEQLGKMDRNTLLKTLETMDTEQIIELAKGMDQTMRNSIIEILVEIKENEKKKGSKREERASVYRPPFYIQRMYDLFTPEQLERAKKNMENARSGMNREAKIAQKSYVASGSNSRQTASLQPVYVEDYMDTDFGEQKEPFGNQSTSHNFSFVENINNMKKEKNTTYQPPSSFFPKTNTVLQKDTSLPMNKYKQETHSEANKPTGLSLLPNLSSEIKISGKSVVITKDLFNMLSKLQQGIGNLETRTNSSIKQEKAPLINKQVGNKENSSDNYHSPYITHQNSNNLQGLTNNNYGKYMSNNNTVKKGMNSKY